jgi:hypothetical protein
MFVTFFCAPILDIFQFTVQQSQGIVVQSPKGIKTSKHKKLKIPFQFSFVV